MGTGEKEKKAIYIGQKNVHGPSESRPARQRKITGSDLIRWRASRCAVSAQAGESSGERTGRVPGFKSLLPQSTLCYLQRYPVTQPLCASVSSSITCKARIGLTFSAIVREK